MAGGEAEWGLCNWPHLSLSLSVSHTHTSTRAHMGIHTCVYTHQRAWSRTSESTSSEDRTQTTKHLTGKELPCIHMLQGGIRDILAPTESGLEYQHCMDGFLRVFLKSSTTQGQIHTYCTHTYALVQYKRNAAQISSNKWRLTILHPSSTCKRDQMSWCVDGRRRCDLDTQLLQWNCSQWLHWACSKVWLCLTVWMWSSVLAETAACATSK